MFSKENLLKHCVSLEHDELHDDRKEERFLLLTGTVCRNEFLLHYATRQPLWCCPMQQQETCSAEGTENETVQEEIDALLLRPYSRD